MSEFTYVSDVPQLFSQGASGEDRALLPRLCIAGGPRLLRESIAVLLQHQGQLVKEACALDGVFEQRIGEMGRLPFDVMVLVCLGGHFSVISRVREMLGAKGHDLPLVVISDQVGRGQVYAALRAGAKAYLNLDTAGEQLSKAIQSAVQDKVFLSDDVAELLVSDVAEACVDTPRPTLRNPELSQRETQVVQYLCEGLSSKEIARQLHLSAKTVENHRYNIYRKCGVDSIASLMRYAIHSGLVTI